MGFRKEKIEIEGKIKRIKRIALWVLLVILSALCIFSAFVPAETWKYHVGKPKIPSREEGELRIHFLDVGQGDCSVIELPDGKTMLVDGGDSSESTAKRVLRYLNALKIKKIDYLLATHADSDHCGSLDKVVKYKDVGEAFIPKTNPEVNTQYLEFYTELKEREIPMSFFKSSIVRNSSVADYPYTLSFLYPFSIEVDTMEQIEEEEDGNEWSAVLGVEYFGISTLFTGDLPTSKEKQLVEFDKVSNKEGYLLSSTDILKVSHHGSEDATSDAFLDYIHAKTAIISCSEDNLYNHPSEKVCNRLKERNITDYRTYRDGNILITVTPNGNYRVDCIKDK